MVNESEPPTPGVVVLGMHRSGTSAVARAINLLGPRVCSEADLIRGVEWNPRGHWECRPLNAFNDRLLSDMGCTWWAPPPGPGPGYEALVPGIIASPAEGRRVFKRTHPGPEPWVWKDPRTCLTLPYWRSAIRPAVAVAVLRDPWEVAASLQLRNGFPLGFGLALWQRYTRLWAAHAAGMAVMVTRFSMLLADPLGWSTAVGTFLGASGIAVAPQPDRGFLEQYVDPALRHVRVEDGLLTSPGQPGDGGLATRSVAEAMEAAVGPHQVFTPPDLGSEPPEVQARLDTVGPGRRPAWRRPTWPVERW